jgi:hypothetical protein
MNLQSAIDKIEKVATVTPEFEPNTAVSDIERGRLSLLSTYPVLSNYTDYLELLRITGGVHIHNSDFSLGIYGFGGYVVTSFDEGLFLDQDRYFRMGEVLYHTQTEPSYALAFDLYRTQDAVYISLIEQSNYEICCNSFVELIEGFAAGKYPGLQGGNN